jgi:hypothetical protein
MASKTRIIVCQTAIALIVLVMMSSMLPSSHAGMQQFPGLLEILHM